MKSYIKIPQTKSNIYTSNTPRQYASVQIKERSNNINSVPIPQAKKNINNYPRKSYSTYSTTHDDNHSFYESKVDTPIGKKYTQRSSYTYKQPESKNYRERKVVPYINDNNNIKKKYETTSYEQSGRRKRKYENEKKQEEIITPKYYRNNPHKFSYNYNKNNLSKDDNIGSLRAQKICNIIIKGDGSNIEKENFNNKNKRKNKNQMIEFEIEEPDKKYYYNNTEENVEEKKIKNRRKNKIKKNNYNNIIEMQKAQSFQQPRDYNFMPNKNKSKQKIVIGIENNNNTKNNYSDEKAKNTRLKTEKNNNRLKYNYIRENHI